MSAESNGFVSKGDVPSSGKMVILKPIVWNSNGYLGPCGTLTSSGYAGEHGYGHEEWNARSDWVWQGWKVFHTEAKGRMLHYAATGDLGIIMTSMYRGKFYAMGVGCNVYKNSEIERREIARDLHLIDYEDKLWAIDAINQRKKNRADFSRHWKREHAWVNWRCPQSHFVWFDRPIEIIPNDIIPSEPARKAIVKMHGSYQAIRPDQAAAIVDAGLPASHPILDWLATPHFDPVRGKDVQRAPAPKVELRNSAAPPVDPYKRYLRLFEVVVDPRHHPLQKKFETFLRRVGASNIRPDIESVDVRFNEPSRGLVLAEIKPTEPRSTRFAVRTAMGQLLDYSQRVSTRHSMLVVIECEPPEEDIELALRNGFGIAWKLDDGEFRVRWPE